ncbi:MAG: thioredoxin family protein [Peptococcaceae bacterium]|nr:thioredoxin family protein [Peptococcaceae bacterium]
MKRYLAILLVVLVGVSVWFLTRPTVPAIISAEPYTEFHAAVERGRPIFIMFTKKGCRACLAMYPLVEELIAQYQDRVAMIVADLADEQTIELARNFEFRAVPHFIMIGRQGETTTLTGHVAKEELQSMIEAGLVWQP